MNPTIIQNKIYEIRGHKIMLDFDLAELYDVETKRLNEQVKRNLERFPVDFMFRLSPEEWETMRSQIVTASGEKLINMRSQFATASDITKHDNWSQFATSSKKHRGKVYLPYAFTEHGVTMLANVLRSSHAIKMSIAVVRAFIALRQIALQHKDLADQLGQLRQELYERLGEHDTQLNAIYEAIENLLEEKAQKKRWEDREQIGFKRQRKC